MSSLFLHDTLAAQGAQFSQRNGNEIVASFADLKTEYSYVRDAVGVTDFSAARIYRLPEDTGVDFLDSVVAGNVAKLRFGRVLHTFIANDLGELVADCYIANNDDELIMVCESLVSDEQLDTLLAEKGGAQAGLECLSQSHVALSIDGFKGWAVARELFGTDVLGLPYLSIEVYTYNNASVRLLRAGKTSEFGYLLVVPNAVAAELYSEMVTCAKAQGGGACGTLVHNELRLEGRFFNIFAEGAAVMDPLTLGLQWMIDFDKEQFSGSIAIMAARAKGLNQKIIGLVGPVGSSELVVGTAILDDTIKVAQVVATSYSYVLDRTVALAVFPIDIAWAGLSFRTDKGQAVETISMPPIMPRSLGVKLDEM